jgi:hypothetical protein
MSDGSWAECDEPAFFGPSIYEFLVTKVRILYVNLFPSPDSFLDPITLFAAAASPRAAFGLAILHYVSQGVPQWAITVLVVPSCWSCQNASHHSIPQARRAPDWPPPLDPKDLR